MRYSGSCAGAHDRRQQTGAQQGRFSRAAHAIDQQESSAVRRELLQPLDASANRARAAKEKIGVIEVEDIEAAKWRLGLLLRGKRHTIGAQRSGDILHLVLAKVQEIEGEPIANVRVDGLGDAYAAGGESASNRAATLTPSPMRLSPSTTTSPRLMPIRNRMRPAPESAFRCDLQLDFGGAANCFDGAGELGDHAVAGASENAAMVA